MSLKTDKLKVVIFDWDGTMVESRTPCVTAMNQILADYGLPQWDISKKKGDKMRSFMDNFPAIFGDKGAKRAYIKYRWQYRKNVASQITIYPYVRKVFDYLKDKGVKLAVMSNKDRRLLRYELPLFFEMDEFAKIVCGHEAPRDKPYAEHAEYTLQGLIDKTEVNPDSVWIIGDSVLDNMCAAAVNAKPIRVNSISDEKIDSDVVYCSDFRDLYQRLLKDNGDEPA